MVAVLDCEIQDTPNANQYTIHVYLNCNIPKVSLKKQTTIEHQREHDLRA